MVGSASPLSFHDLRGVQDSQQRFVSGADGFKPANQGSLLGKVVSWLNETFRPGHVKEQNIAAYTQAKSAFLASGGDRAYADAAFKDGIAGHATFTPGAIRSAHQHVISPDETRMLFDQIKTAADGRLADPAGFTTLTTPSGQSVTNQFMKDVLRQDNRINQTLVVGKGQNDEITDNSEAASVWSEALRSEGVSEREIAGLSAFTHQNTFRSITEYVLEPGGRGLSTPGGRAVVPMIKPRMSFDITPNHDGTFKIDVAGGSDIVHAFTLDANGNTQPPENVDANSHASVTFSMIVGPGADGNLTLRSLDNVKCDVDIFLNNKRLV